MEYPDGNARYCNSCIQYTCDVCNWCGIKITSVMIHIMLRYSCSYNSFVTCCTVLRKRKYISLFDPFTTLKRYRNSTFFLMEGRGRFIIHSQHHVFCCLGDSMSRGINSHNDDQVVFKYSGTRRIDVYKYTLYFVCLNSLILITSSRKLWTRIR